MRTEKGKNWTAIHGDSVEIWSELESNTLGYIIFSPPFESIYAYSDDPADMGNCANREEFFEHMGYLSPHLFRTLQPGRLMSFHCMNLPALKERDGFIGLHDFRGDLIRHYQEQGFIFHSEVCIWKDPLVAMQRTKAIGLLHKQLVKDSAMSRQGVADYLVTMRKPGVNENPIRHGAGFDKYIGEDAPVAAKTGNPATNKFGHEVWQRYASPVWMDIKQGDVLKFAGAKAEKDERHICPLQRQVVARGLELWSNPGDLVGSPFGGIGTEGYEALLSGRRCLLSELKPTYFEQLLINLKNAESMGTGQDSLFGDELTDEEIAEIDRRLAEPVIVDGLY